jgi:type I restriction enzyme M protein
MVETYGEDFADEHRFQIPEGFHWRDVRETAANVGTALLNALRGIESANQEHLYGVFGDAQWTNKERLPDALLKDLLEHFSALNLNNSHVESDIVGDAYEYLIKQFADATNKKAGEFYTPRSVVDLMVEILDPKEGETIYDPACGTGGMLISAINLSRLLISFSTVSMRFSNPATRTLSRAMSVSCVSSVMYTYRLESVRFKANRLESLRPTLA